MTFKWSKKYETGFEKIDSQHKKLLDLTNELYNEVVVNKREIAVSEIIIELKLFTIFHFTEEKKLFKKYGYLDNEYEEHLEQHEKFLSKVGEFISDDVSSKLNLSYQILEFLRSYITEHILDYDMKFISYLKKNHFTEISLDEDITYME